jgi:uncharacterized protein YndB with AHSA1/START domain
MSTPMRQPDPQEPGATVVTMPAPRQIRIERIFAAPLDSVWRAYTEADLIAQWWGRGNPLDIERFEVRPGGRWRFVEHAPDGDAGFGGVFREITPRRRLVQTFEWDGMPGHAVLDTATFEDLGDGRTRVVTTSSFDTPEERDGMLAAGMEGGLSQSYEALDRLLTRLA